MHKRATYQHRHTDMHAKMQTYMTYLKTHKHTHTYMCTNTSTHIHAQTYMHKRTHTCAHTHIHTQTHAYKLRFTHIHAQRAHIQTVTDTHVKMQAHMTYLKTHKHRHTYMCTNTYTQT